MGEKVELQPKFILIKRGSPGIYSLGTQLIPTSVLDTCTLRSCGGRLHTYYSWEGERVVGVGGEGREREYMCVCVCMEIWGEMRRNMERDEEKYGRR